ncbi:MAG: hypothetical protein ACJARR_003902 [Pseudophaeobacter arcticus]
MHAPHGQAFELWQAKRPLAQLWQQNPKKRPAGSAQNLLKLGKTAEKTSARDN